MNVLVSALLMGFSITETLDIKTEIGITIVLDLARKDRNQYTKYHVSKNCSLERYRLKLIRM